MAPHRDALRRALLEVRHAAALGQDRWAAVLSTSPSAVQRWEGGQALPSPATLARYARAAAALGMYDTPVEARRVLGELLLLAGEEA